MKIFGLILTYNCERLVEKTINLIPQNHFEQIICADDGSYDQTGNVVKKKGINFFSHEHLGYGGNLLFGLEKAFDLGATHVVEIHGDGQYNLENLESIISNFKLKNSDLILGNRFYNYKKTLKNGMPLHIFIGNIVLSFISKLGLQIDIKDFFPGQRAYSRKFFEIIKKHKLPKGYQFSLEIIMLSKLYNLNISSVNCDCDYLNERKTAPITYIFSCIIHMIKIFYLFNFKKSKILKKTIEK